MFEEYQSKVLSDYRTKKSDGLLRQFEHITPALLKKECVNILVERGVSQNDLITLRTFFGSDEKGKGYAKIIGDFPTTNFRSLSNFFRNSELLPERRNIELIAWLINFQPRPYAEALDAYEVSKKSVEVNLVDVNEDEKTGNSEEGKTISSKEKDDIKSNIEEVEINQEEQKVGSVKIWKNQNIKKALWSFLAATIVFGGSYFAWQQVDKQCMYWTGNQYKPVTCDTKIPDATVIALDEIKVTHLKRITKRDTLTEYSIGKVFYGKKNGNIEFYTDSGENPLDNQKRLLPMTKYILDKYIFNSK